MAYVGMDDRIRKSARSLAASSGSSRADDFPLLSSARPSTRERTPSRSHSWFPNGLSENRTLLTQRNEHSPGVITREIGQLESDTSALVPDASVLVPGWGVPPTLGFEQRPDRLGLVEPDGEIDVVVLARDGSDVEVDPPPAEEPVLESGSIEDVANLGQRRQLLRGERFCVCHSGAATREASRRDTA